MRRFEFGTRARDVVTGFEGTVTGHVSYMTGCDQYILTPRVDKDGKVVDSRWFDELRLEAVEAATVLLPRERDRSAARDDGPGEPAPLY